MLKKFLSYRQSNIGINSQVTRINQTHLINSKHKRGNSVQVPNPTQQLFKQNSGSIHTLKGDDESDW